MITAPAALASRRAIRGFRDHQPSSAERCADRRGYAAQGPIANPVRKGPMLAVQALRASYERCNLDRDDTNGRAGFAVDEVAANLAAFANCPVLSLSGTTRVVVLGLAVGIGRDNPMCHRTGKLFSNKGFDIHGGNSNPVSDTIGPLALYVNCSVEALS